MTLLQRLRGRLAPGLRTYAPFLVVIVLQAAVIVVAPSTPDDRTTVPGTGGELGFVDGGAPATPGASTTLVGTADPSTGGSSGTVGGQGEVGDPSGDRGHCTPDGRQFALLYLAPPCAAAWPDGADNGGATARGVTATSVRVSVVLRKGSALADQLSASQGLGVTPEELRGQIAAAQQFINANYELHGRKLDLRFVQSSCEIGPTDVPCYRELARSLSRDNFMVIYPNYEPDAFFEELTRNGTIALGGWFYSDRTFAAQAPYLYDVFPNGSLVARFFAEYYCKKLSGRPADHAGTTIHGSIGSRSSTTRRMGIITYDRGPLAGAAQELQALMARCGGSTPVVIAMAPDVTSFQQQTDAVMADLISSKVTTIVPMLDPAATSLLTLGATRQGYYPEWFVTGYACGGWDACGRLQDAKQWKHAFGLDAEPSMIPAEQLAVVKVWRATGRSGMPGAAPYYAEFFFRYFQMAATMLQLAGPDLNAANVEAATVGAGYSRGGWTETGGRPDVPLWKFGGPGGHTAFADVREIYWDAGRTSVMDGRTGAYVDANGGRRWALGQMTEQMDVPAAPS